MALKKSEHRPIVRGQRRGAFVREDRGGWAVDFLPCNLDYLRLLSGVSGHVAAFAARFPQLVPWAVVWWRCLGLV